ncbi:MAG: hybrid sensor histidine kinase/response regulator [Bacteroidetes bacterium]|nr:MAG: hybrid sensor histidine kinase/response regulator [Bacteroidota bacterium]
MISSLKNDKGVISHFMAIKEDITEKKRVEKELKSAKEKAEEADHLKSSFLANMSHEIRTPLNAIMGFSSLISEYDIDGDEAAKFIDIIQTNSKQLLDIIDDVLLVSKLQVNQVKVYSSVFIIDLLLKELYTHFKKEIELFPEKEITLKIEIRQEDRIEKIETDKVKLNQILSKLIRNAIKFTSKGIISFGYKLNKNDELIFFTKDTGIGISEDKQKIIFQKFRQVDDSKTRQFGGTGLGLSIVKGLVDLLQGNLWLESNKDNGANFYFTIPLKIINKKIKKKTKTKEKLKWEKKTILVVDDVTESVLLIKEILKPTGINIITASNGLEAIEKCKLHSEIDLILMDIQLPKLNGLIAAKRIRTKNNIPIIAQSAYLQHEYEKQCKELGCNDFIQKPIITDELMSKIENYI